MKYRYTSPHNFYVHVIADDGTSAVCIPISDVPHGAEIQPYVAPPAPVPVSITMRQARLALFDWGITEAQVESAINAIEDEAQRARALIEWRSGSIVERQSSVVAMLSSALSLSAEQLDGLFRKAATL